MVEKQPVAHFSVFHKPAKGDHGIFSRMLLGDGLSKSPEPGSTALQSKIFKPRETALLQKIDEK